MTMQKLGSWIKQARKDTGYTQVELAEILGVDATYISKIENAKTAYMPSYELLEKIAAAFYVEFDDVLRLAGYYDAQKLHDKAAQIPLLGSLLSELQEVESTEELVERVGSWHNVFGARGILNQRAVK